MSKKSEAGDVLQAGQSLFKRKPEPRGKRGQLRKLNKAWRKASQEERAAFLTALGIKGSELEARSRKDGGPIANGRYLLPKAVADIEHVMIRRDVRPEAVMAELGFPGQGVALTRALARGASLRLAVIVRLQIWLEAETASPGD